MGDEMRTETIQVRAIVRGMRYVLRCLAYWIGRVTAMNLNSNPLKHLKLRLFCVYNYFAEGNILLKERTQTTNNEIKLVIYIYSECL